MSAINGMRNLGNTCYLNAAIQCLLSMSCMPTILHNIKDPKPPAVLFLMDCFSLQTGVRFPDVLYEQYLSLHDNKRHMPEDAVECFLRLLQYIEDNLKKSHSTISMNGCACSIFWNNTDNLTLVQENFVGLLYIKMKCTTCNVLKKKFESFQILPIHIETSSSLREGLIRLITFSENIEGVECENCKQNRTFTVNQSFHRLPKVLLFEIVGDADSFHFDEILVIDHTHGNEYAKLSYRLKTVVIYNGSHYTCISYDSLARNYVFIDDDKTFPIQLTTSIRVRCLLYEVI